MQRHQTLSLAGQWESNAAVLATLASLVQYGRDRDHHDEYAERVNALTPADVHAVARGIIRPDPFEGFMNGKRLPGSAGGRRSACWQPGRRSGCSR